MWYTIGNSVAITLSSTIGDTQQAIMKNFIAKVVGVTYPNDDGSSRQKYLSQCKVGEQVDLIPDKNQHDKNAIKVVRKGKQLGYLSRLCARITRKKSNSNRMAHIAEIGKYNNIYYAKLLITEADASTPPEIMKMAAKSELKMKADKNNTVIIMMTIIIMAIIGLLICSGVISIASGV